MLYMSLIDCITIDVRQIKSKQILFSQAALMFTRSNDKLNLYVSNDNYDKYERDQRLDSI